MMSQYLHFETEVLFKHKGWTEGCRPSSNQPCSMRLKHAMSLLFNMSEHSTLSSMHISCRTRWYMPQGIKQSSTKDTA